MNRRGDRRTANGSKQRQRKPGVGPPTKSIKRGNELKRTGWMDRIRCLRMKTDCFPLTTLAIVSTHASQKRTVGKQPCRDKKSDSIVKRKKKEADRSSELRMITLAGPGSLEFVAPLRKSNLKKNRNDLSTSNQSVRSARCVSLVVFS